MKKHKENRRAGLSDKCQTPPYALEPLLPWLDKRWTIWEPACGEGLLAQGLRDNGFLHVIETDIEPVNMSFSSIDFLNDPSPLALDCIVTNPPYSFPASVNFIRHCYELGKPFALLMKVSTLGLSSAQKLFDTHGVEIILLDKRVNFKMPLKGWDGDGSHFSVAWFTWGLNIGETLTYGEIHPVDYGRVDREAKKLELLKSGQAYPPELFEHLNPRGTSGRRDPNQMELITE